MAVVTPACSTGESVETGEKPPSYHQMGGPFKELGAISVTLGALPPASWKLILLIK